MIEDFFKVLFDNSTILFVFIAGFLFQYLNNTEFNFGKYFTKKLRFVMLPYIIISIPAILNNLFLKSDIIWMPESIQGNYGLEVAYMILTGKQLGPFWFMPMIFIFFSLAPFFLFVNKKKFYFYVFPIIFIFGLFTYKFGYFSNTLESFIHYLPVYLFGMFASFFQKEISKSGQIILPSLTILYLVLFFLEYNNFVSVPYLNNFNDAANEPFLVFNPSMFRQLILCIILLLALEGRQSKRFNIFIILGDYSFGIYFLHIYVIIIIKRVIDIVLPNYESNLFSYLILSILVILISSTIVRLIKRITGSKSRYFIGS